MNKPATTPSKKSHIRLVELLREDASPLPSMVARDRATALRDLQRESFFQPASDTDGPYVLRLSIEENRLVFRIQNAQERELPMLVLALKPYKRIIKDYFMIMHSYEEALRDGKPSRIEAIDMGRRALHNEGASLLQERLGDKIKMDRPTARRLFTLICVLHASKTALWRG